MTDTDFVADDGAAPSRSQGKTRTRTLRWRMTRDEAIAWCAAHPGSSLELISAQARRARYGGRLPAAK